MITSEFGSLPLSETRLIVRSSRGESKMGYEFLSEALRNVADELPEIQQFMVDHGPSVGFQFHAGPGAGMECSTGDGALSLSVRSGGIELAWRAGRGTDYPRFAKMSDLVSKIPDVWGLDVATIAYVNRVECEEGETLFDYFNLPVDCRPSELKELNLNRSVWHGDASYDFRIQARLRSAGEWFFSTSCGTKTAGSAFEVLENVHDACNVKFRELLTDNAERKWQLS